MGNVQLYITLHNIVSDPDIQCVWNSSATQFGRLSFLHPCSMFSLAWAAASWPVPLCVAATTEPIQLLPRLQRSARESSIARVTKPNQTSGWTDSWVLQISALTDCALAAQHYFEKLWLLCVCCRQPAVALYTMSVSIGVHTTGGSSACLPPAAAGVRITHRITCLNPNLQTQFAVFVLQHLAAVILTGGHFGSNWNHLRGLLTSIEKQRMLPGL